MTTLVTGDPHFSANPRDSYRWKFLEETLPQMIAEHGVNRVLILGDLTEQKDGHPSMLVNRLVDGIAALAKCAGNIYVLKGNHDYRAEDVPFFRFLRHIPRVRWINKPTRLNLIGLGDCMFLPHAGDCVKEWTQEGVPTMKVDWFFCHATFDGTKTETGHSLSGVPRSIFPQGSRVVSGDIHTPHDWYVGAPYSVDFGDSYDPRVLILDGTKKKSIPVPGPQKRLITASGLEPLLELHAGKHSRKSTAHVNPGDIVKVRVEIPAGTDVSRADVRARVRDWAARNGVELGVTEVLSPRAASGAVTTRRSHKASDEELVRAYAKKMGKGKSTVAAGLKIMEKAS